MLTIPTQAVPAQTFTVSLAGQPCRLSIYQRSTGLYVDLYINDTLIIGGVIARNQVRLVRNFYFGFAGDLAFVDTQGGDDPSYDGLGSRWALMYLETSDLNGIA